MILLYANNKGTDQPAQSDQHRCYSLPATYNNYTSLMQNLNILVSLCSWAHWFESYLVGSSEYQFSQDKAHMIL